MFILSPESIRAIGLDIPLPEINSLWTHRESSEVYQVYDLTNLNSTREKHPIRVSYRRISDGSTWSRPLARWYDDYDLTQLP